MDFKNTLLERLERYVKINSASSRTGTTAPTTKEQLEFAEILKKEVTQLGLKNARISNTGQLYAELPANTDKKLPSIGFIAHMDTVDDFPAINIKPKLHKNYQGGPIELKPGMFLTPEKEHMLHECIGDDILTASGDTILGADDKAGISAIMAMCEYFIKNPSVKHGDIKIAFTPDEENGSGVANFDIKGFGADYAYTIDGMTMGCVGIGNFNADNGILEIEGVMTHPGHAKGAMINPSILAAEIIAAWPKEYLPENTEGLDGFIHFSKLTGTAERAEVRFNVREHDMQKLQALTKKFTDIVDKTQAKYPAAKLKVTIKPYFRSMKEGLEKHPAAMEHLIRALTAEGLPYKPEQARGGTDGARLTIDGLPCPDIFAGYSAAHGPYEWCSIDKLNKATNLIIRIASAD